MMRMIRSKIVLDQLEDYCGVEQILILAKYIMELTNKIPSRT